MQRIILPQIGDREEGNILRWHKQKGDPIQQGDTLVEVETENIIIEIESFSSGIVREILAQEGEMVLVGAVLAFIGTITEPLPDPDSALRRTKKIVQPANKEHQSLQASTRWQRAISLFLILILLGICLFKGLWFSSVITGIFLVLQIFLMDRIIRH